MTIKKQIATASLSIEIQSGVDKAGLPTYTKKNFSNLRTDVTPENAYAVAEAVKSVLSASTRKFYLNESSSIAQE